jgi:hypothetical protein
LTNLDTFCIAAFASSIAFDAINATLQSDAADRGNAIKDANAVFAFTLTNEKGDEESWYLDLKEKGVVGKGAAPEGSKADG